MPSFNCENTNLNLPLNIFLYPSLHFLVLKHLPDRLGIYNLFSTTPNFLFIFYFKYFFGSLSWVLYEFLTAPFKITNFLIHYSVQNYWLHAYITLSYIYIIYNTYTILSKNSIGYSLPTLQLLPFQFHFCFLFYLKQWIILWVGSLYSSSWTNCTHHLFLSL